MNNQYPVSYGGPGPSPLDAPGFIQREVDDAKHRKHARTVEYHAMWQLIKRIASRPEYQPLAFEARKDMLERGVSHLRGKRRMEGKAVGLINTDEMIHRHLHKPAHGASGPSRTPLGPPPGDYRSAIAATPYRGGDLNGGFPPNADFPQYDFNSLGPITEEADDMGIKLELNNFPVLDDSYHGIGDIHLGGPIGGFGLPRLDSSTSGLVRSSQGNVRQPLGPLSPDFSVESYEDSLAEEKQEGNQHQQQGGLDFISRVERLERDIARQNQTMSEMQARIDELEGHGQGKGESRVQRRLEGLGQNGSSSSTGQIPGNPIELS